MQNKTLQRKRALRTALLVLLLSAVGLGKGYAVIIGDLKYDLDNNTLKATVIGHKDNTHASGSLTIPSSVTYTSYEWVNGQQVPVTRTYTVAGIRAVAFKDCIGLTGSLTIPNSVTWIGVDAFENCSGFNGSLTLSNSLIAIGGDAFYNCSGFTGSLTIPNSVTTIEGGAFGNCRGFTGDLIIPNSVTSIGGSAFWYCSGFTGNLTFPNSVTYIGGSAFQGCSGFTGELIIPNSVTYIGGEAFRGCNGFTGNLIIGNSVTTIGSEAFRDCTGFNGSLIIGDSVTTIGQAAFRGCSGFTGNLIIPNSVISIGKIAFFRCTGFTGSLTIPNSVTTIGGEAFSGCYKFMGDLTIGNSVTTIEMGAFTGCSGFTGRLTIGNSVTLIEDYAFQDCLGFTSMTVLAETPPSASGTCVFRNVPKDIPVYVPCNSIGEYQAATGWNAFTNYIGAYPYHLTVEADEPEHCIVSIVQQPSCEESQGIVKAEPTEGYVFVAWEEDGTVVSTNTVYTFTVDRDIHLVARVKSNTGVLESFDECIIVLYPNPTNSQIKIETEDLKHITISNLLGQTIFDGNASGNIFEYDFSKQKAGIYLFRIETANGVAVKKVSVIH